MNILLLAARDHVNNLSDNVDLPVYLHESEGKTILEEIIDRCSNINEKKFIFVFIKDDISCWNLDSIAEQLNKHSIVVSLERAAEGALCSALLAKKYINTDDELLIISSNELIKKDLSQIIDRFHTQNSDAGVVSFTSLSPRYAYARKNKDGEVVEVCEKKPISNLAISGSFWFKHGHDFVDSAEDVIRKDTKINNKFYISSTINELILNSKKIDIFSIENNEYIPLKSERQRDNY